MMQIAVAQYEIEALPTWQAYEDKIVRLIEQSTEDQAQLLLMSEYAGVELASWTQGKVQKQFEIIQSMLPEYLNLFISLAKEYQVYIQPGTIPIKEQDHYFNRAYFFSPSGEYSFQNKMNLSPYEKQTNMFIKGEQLCVFETNFGNIGIIIDSDIEFPLLTHSLAQHEVELILVPSCTERLNGLTRLQISARARAIENQCYVAQSCLIGKASWCEFIDINIGQSAIYSPADIGFPENGIIAQAEINTPMLVHALLDYEKLAHVRSHGDMQNFTDYQAMEADQYQPIKVKL